MQQFLLAISSLVGLLRAVRLPSFVMRQNVALGLHIQHVNIVVGQVDDPHPAAGRVNDYRGG
ncbi:TPA: hypothetical protein MBF27_001356 [Klebsiella pneumoniae]|nr:hypothetical protein [Klebsiella pneumoniae]HCB0012742.1 hypothetical protein [Klebsiella pneumoniae]